MEIFTPAAAEALRRNQAANGANSTVVLSRNDSNASTFLPPGSRILPKATGAFSFVGAVVEYESASRGWMPAKVVAFHASTGLYDLDCKTQVPEDRIRWPDGPEAADADSPNGASETGSSPGGLLANACVPHGVRVRVGTLDFHTRGNLGLPGLFDDVSFRVTVGVGDQQPTRPWDDAGELKPGRDVTKLGEVKFGRTISSSGSYVPRIRCDFDEAFDFPWPVRPSPEQPNAPEQFSADIWIERRTVVEKVDSIMDMFGLGNNFPERERKWVGRAVVELPKQGVKTKPELYLVEVDKTFTDGPLPKALQIGVEWVTDGSDEADSDSEAMTGGWKPKAIEWRS